MPKDEMHEEWVIPLVADGTSGNRELELVLSQEFAEYLALWKHKQRSYGVGNIAEYGELGCLIRATDKIKRLRNIVYKGIGNPLSDETIEDTWLDLLGYAAMGLMCRRGQWPGVEKEEKP